MVEFPGNISELLNQAKELSGKMSDIQSEIASKEVEASAGGGMVTVRMNGNQQLLEVKLEKEVVNSDDIAMLQDLVTAAVNEAVRKSKELVKEEMGKLTGGLPIPGLF